MFLRTASYSRHSNLWGGHYYHEHLNSRSARRLRMPKSTGQLRGSPEPRCSCSSEDRELDVSSFTDLVYNDPIFGELPSRCLGSLWLMAHCFLRGRFLSPVTPQMPMNIHFLEYEKGLLCRWAPGLCHHQASNLWASGPCSYSSLFFLVSSCFSESFCFLFIWSWASYFTFRCFSFPVGKMGIKIIELTS